MQTLFWSLLSIIKIDLCNFELYRFKVGAFFETQCICYKSLVYIPRGICEYRGFCASLLARWVVMAKKWW